MNHRSGTLSPVSVAGSDWSGISKYESISPGTPGIPPMPYSPGPGGPGPNRGPATPPVSGSMPPPNGNMAGPGPMQNQNHGAPLPPLQNGPSPSRPGSVQSQQASGPSGRASLSTGQPTEADRKRLQMMEHSLGIHYGVLHRYLAISLKDTEGNPRLKRARDKLLRLSQVQFHELSTDVYDELCRREAARRESKQPQPPAQPPHHVPPHLPPRDDFHPKRNHARQKLSTLPPPRFRDLATDVFYELERRFPHFAGQMIERTDSPASIRTPRMSNSSMRSVHPPGPHAYGPPGTPGPHGPVRGPPPGVTGRFPPRHGSLGPGMPHAPPGPPGPAGPMGPVMHSQGPPVMMNGPGGPLNGMPMQKTSQGNTIVPNKSTMVEEEEDDDDEQLDDYDDLNSVTTSNRQSRRDTRSSTRSMGMNSSDKDRKLVEYQSQVGLLQEKVDLLQGRMNAKDDELNALRLSQHNDQVSEREKAEWDHLRSDLEKKLENAVSLNNSLQAELVKVRQDQSSAGGMTDGEEWRTRYEDLAKEHHELKQEFHKQQEVTEEVRKQASTFLEEMKSLSKKTNQNCDREENLAKEVRRLEEDVKEWKSRYAKAKTQLRNLRATSIGLTMSQPNAAQAVKDSVFTQADGSIRDIHVTKFQISIDELLQIARTGEPASVLEYMKTVVAAVKHITQDVDATPIEAADVKQQCNKQKQKISSTANNLITAAKNFAGSHGISPVSLLDAAASHLTTSVVEMIRIVKIKPTPTGDLDEDDDESIPTRESQALFENRNRQSSRTSLGESVYSFDSDPKKNGFPPPPSIPRNLINGNELSPTQKLSFDGNSSTRDLEDLKIYLEDQTDGLIQSIQALVSSVRAEDDTYTIQGHIDDISSVVGNVVAFTQRTFEQTSDATLQDQTEHITQKLSDCRLQLMDASSEVTEIQDAGKLREFTNRLPPLAFEIARQTKDLVQRIEHFGQSEGDDDDFR